MNKSIKLIEEAYGDMYSEEAGRIRVREVEYNRGYDRGEYLGEYSGSLSEVMKQFKGKFDEDMIREIEEYSYADEENGVFYVGGEEGLAYEGFTDNYKWPTGEEEVDEHGLPVMKDWEGNVIDYDE